MNRGFTSGSLQRAGYPHVTENVGAAVPGFAPPRLANNLAGAHPMFGRRRLQWIYSDFNIVAFIKAFRATAELTVFTANDSLCDAHTADNIIVISKKQ